MPILAAILPKISWKTVSLPEEGVEISNVFSTVKEVVLIELIGIHLIETLDEKGALSSSTFTCRLSGFCTKGLRTFHLHHCTCPRYSHRYSGIWFVLVEVLSVHHPVFYPFGLILPSMLSRIPALPFGRSNLSISWRSCSFRLDCLVSVSAGSWPFSCFRAIFYMFPLFQDHRCLLVLYWMLICSHVLFSPWPGWFAHL